MGLIEITGLSKTYGKGGKSVEALRGVDLSVEAGEIYGVIGLSGAGKSTLIRCLNRLETPTTGRVVVDGRDLTAMTEAELRLARREMGMIFQHFNLLSSRTVADNVAFPMEIAGRDKTDIGPRVTELLTLVGLSDKAQAYPAQLSGGQKQRVGIARALANSPKVLLCDEATSALDPQTTQSILALIQSVKRQLGLTVVLITHEDSSREWGYEPRGVLVRTLFIGQPAGAPVISSLVRRFKVEANILQGDIGHLQGQPFGTMVIDLIGEAPERDRALEFLHSLNLPVEVLDRVADA